MQNTFSVMAGKGMSKLEPSFPAAANIIMPFSIASLMTCSIGCNDFVRIPQEIEIISTCSLIAHWNAYI